MIPSVELNARRRWHAIIGVTVIVSTIQTLLVWALCSSMAASSASSGVVIGGDGNGSVAMARTPLKASGGVGATSLAATSIKLGGNPFANLSVMAGSPNGTVTGNIGDTIWDTSTPAFWQCQGGTVWTAGITGTGTQFNVPVFSTASSLINSSRTDNGTTVTETLPVQETSTTQLVERQRFSGQEWLAPSTTSTNGVSEILFINSTGDRRLMLYDSASGFTQANNIYGLVFDTGASTGPGIETFSTDGTGTTSLNIQKNSNGNVQFGIGQIFYDTSGDLYMSGGSGINYSYTTNGVATGHINQNGYQNGTTQFRNLEIDNGENAAACTFTGSTKVLNCIGGYQINGTAFNATGELIDVQQFTTTGTYTPTTGTNSVIVEEVGGGGGGGGALGAASSAAVGGGGASGVYLKIYLTGVTSGGTATVGTGGAGGTAGNNAGSNGTVSSIVINSTTYTAEFGNGGSGGPSAGANFSATIGGAPNAGSTTGTAVVATAGGGGSLGVVSEGLSVAIGGAGGSNPLGYGGASIGFSAAGRNGSGYGAGGGGAAVTTSSAAGGNGTNGIILVYEYH